MLVETNSVHVKVRLVWVSPQEHPDGLSDTMQIPGLEPEQSSSIISYWAWTAG